MRISSRKLRRIIRESFSIPEDVLDMYADYIKAVEIGDKAAEKKIADHFKGVIAVLDKFDNVDGDREKEGTDEFSVQAFRNMIAREGPTNESKKMKVTKKQLRRIIFESIFRENERIFFHYVIPCNLCYNGCSF